MLFLENRSVDTEKKRKTEEMMWHLDLNLKDEHSDPVSLLDKVGWILWIFWCLKDIFVGWVQGLGIRVHQVDE